MRKSKKFLSWFVPLATLTPFTLAVRNGLDGNSMSRTVFMQQSRDADFCSAVNMIHDRCLVTAAECINRIPTPITPEQAIYRTNQSGQEYTQAVQTFNAAEANTYLAVAWLKNLLDKAGVKRIQAGRDYSPRDFGTTAGLEDYNGPLPPTAPSAGSPINGLIYGYGANASVGNVANGTNTGGGILRGGLPDINNFMENPSSTTYYGANYWVEPRPQDGNPTRIACKGNTGLGDIGGPLFLYSGTGVYGILAYTYGEFFYPDTRVCDFVTAGNYIAIGSVDGAFAPNSITDPDFNTNYLWTKNTIRTTCRKTILVGFEPEASGKVTGTITPAVTPLTTDPGKEFNGEINYDGMTNTDYKEALHTGESIDLLAVPNAGYRFKNWRSVLPYTCPCANSSISTCQITYNNIGVYTPDVSIDDAICAAVFEVIPPATCGNFIVDPPSEQCDDGNSFPGDGCVNCLFAICGDGYIKPGEQCDDGNTVSSDGCSSSCIIERCGDFAIQPNLNETCDDGNTFPGDGCSSSCRTETCGDGVIKTGEQCDDGNTLSFDGCSDTCQVEYCGDGVLQELLGEECDDHNTNPGDGCSATCTIEL